MNIWRAVYLILENDNLHRATMRGVSRSELMLAPMRLKVLDLFTTDVIMNDTDLDGVCGAHPSILPAVRERFARGLACPHL